MKFFIVNQALKVHRYSEDEQVKEFEAQGYKLGIYIRDGYMDIIHLCSSKDPDGVNYWKYTSDVDECCEFCKLAISDSLRVTKIMLED